MKIANNYQLGMLTTAVAAASVASAFGFSVALTSNSYQQGSGGEFTATVNDNSLDAYLSTYSQLSTGDPGANSFHTFCLEHSENFYWNTPYVATVSEAAMSGNTSAGKDPLSIGSGWLYSEFAKGTLMDINGANYFADPTATRTQNAGLLQNAIWWLEGELTTSQASNKYILAAAAAFGITSTVPVAAPGEGGAGLAADSYNGMTAAWLGVHVLNLGPYAGNTTISQDQLIYISTGNQVPDGGATLLLLGLGMAGLGALQHLGRRTNW